MDLLKIDVDGIEMEILKGAKNLIQNFRPIIIVEVNEEQNIINFLSHHNYTLLNLDLEQHNLINLNSNIFCVPTKEYFPLKAVK